MKHEELEQRLWELEYGLLSDEDALALRARIAGDSAVAQAHEQVRSRISLVTQAARIEGPRIPLRVPAEADAEGETESPFAPAPAPRPQGSAQASMRIKRAANWSLGIASSLLAGLFVWNAWSTTAQPVRQVANAPAASRTPYLIVGVDTPRRLSREASNQIVLWTRSADGTPQPAALKLSLDDASGAKEVVREVMTDEFGRAVVELPRTESDATSLYVAAADLDQPELKIDLAAAETQYSTHLSTDKPRYRPGEVVRYRSLTLSRFGLQAPEDMVVEFQVTDPSGQEVTDSKLIGATARGVGNGQLPLSADAAPGQYTLFARNPSQAFPEVQRDFVVQMPVPREFDFEVNWGDTSFAAGGEARAKVAVRTPGGAPASNVKLNLRAYVDGRQIDVPPEVETDAVGMAAVEFGLPALLSSSEGELGIQAGKQEVIWKGIPLRANQVQVDFYPEGGDLVAGVENRVYFHTHDLEGRAVAIRGRVVDAAGRERAAVATGQTEGRGAFRFAPDPGATYALVIDEPAGIQSRPPLPSVADASHLALDAGVGVFDGGSTIPLILRSQTAPAEFLLAAYCRSVLVGQRAGTAAEFRNGVCAVELPVLDEAAGVLRLTVFGGATQPPEPLAERLVYRRPLRKIHLEWSGLQPKYSPGASVCGEIVTKDETGQPISAVLGVSAVDRQVLQLAGRPAPRAATQFMLLGDVNSPERLEDANFYVAEESAAASLDLLLGTQGWRRFERVSSSRLAGRQNLHREGLAFRAGGLFEAEAAGKSLAVDATAGGTAVVADLGGLEDISDEAPSRFDNRAVVESLGVTLEQLTRNPLPSQPVQPPESRGGVVVLGCGLLLLAAAALVIRLYPTRTALLAGLVVGALFVVLLAGVGIRWLLGARDENTVMDILPTDLRATTVESAGDSRESAAPLGGVGFGANAGQAASGSGAGVAGRELPPQAAAAENFDRKRADNVPDAAAPLPAAPAPARSAAPAAAQELAPAVPMPAPAMVPVPRSAEALPPASAKAKLGVGAVEGAAPVRDPALKLESKLGKDPASNEAYWRRLGERTVDEKLRWKLAEGAGIARAKTERPDLAPGGAVGANTTGVDGLGRSLPGVTPRDQETRTRQARTEPTAEMSKQDSLEQFVVRRYARVAAKDSKELADHRLGNDFSETLLWDPLLVTDDQGRAHIEFVVPDTVTQFRILAEGHQDGRLGESERSVVVEGRVEP